MARQTGEWRKQGVGGVFDKGVWWEGSSEGLAREHISDQGGGERADRQTRMDAPES